MPDITDLPKHKVVTRQEWDQLRANLLQKEKELTKQRDSLAEEIRSLPWLKIEKNYVFQTKTGNKTLIELFENKSQLVVYHFMFSPGGKPCRSCSFWADNFNGPRYHLPQRDVTFKVISKAPLEEIEPYRKRMGWEFDWVSSFNTDFNSDFEVSTVEGEQPGLSVFYRDGDNVYLSYTSRKRGMEFLNPVYGILDLVPKGRDEKGLEWPMAWVKPHDEY